MCRIMCVIEKFTLHLENIEAIKYRKYWDYYAGGHITTNISNMEMLSTRYFIQTFPRFYDAYGYQTSRH